MQLLARERGLNISDDSDLRSLLADLPANVRRHAPKLKRLAAWPPDVADRIGIDDDDAAGVIGYDKVKELDALVGAIRRGHPETAAAYEGEKLQRQVLDLYFKGVFRGGRRSQDAIREARGLLRKLPQDHLLVKRFVKGTLKFSDKDDAEPNLVALAS